MNIRVFGFSIVAGLVGMSAFSGCIESSPSGILPDASTSSSGGSSGVSSSSSGDVPDSGEGEIDSGLVTDAGDIGIDFDGGLFDDAGSADSGVDGGPRVCNSLSRAGVSQVTAVCDSTLVRQTGGTLVAGTYVLTDVRVIGSAAACTTFVATGHTAKLELTLGRTATAQWSEFLSANGRGADIRRSQEYAVGVAPAMTIKTTCPNGVADTAVTYSTYKSRIDNKQKLILVVPYGRTATARYIWSL